MLGQTLQTNNLAFKNDFLIFCVRDILWPWCFLKFISLTIKWFKTSFFISNDVSKSNFLLSRLPTSHVTFNGANICHQSTRGMLDTKFNFVPPCLERKIVGKVYRYYIRKKVNAGKVNKLLPFQRARTLYFLKHNLISCKQLRIFFAILPEFN